MKLIPENKPKDINYYEREVSELNEMIDYLREGQDLFPNTEYSHDIKIRIREAQKEIRRIKRIINNLSVC